MRYSLIAVVTFAVMAGSSPARGQCAGAWPAPTPDSLRTEVLAELHRYYADLSARDWDAFADHFWPAATFATIWAPPGETGPRPVIRTIPEFVAQAPLGPYSKPIFEERMLDAVVTGYGPLAQVWARYEARFGEPGNVREWRGVDAFTLLKHDGRWRISALSYTDEP